MASEFQALLSSKSQNVGRTVKDTLTIYLSYWPLYIIGLVLGLAASWTYLRYTHPVYQASTTINVKGETNRSGGAAASPDLINSAMNGGRAVINLDNELSRLRSARLMDKVVRMANLNIRYYRKGTVINTEIFTDAPFRLLPRNIQDSSRKISLEVSKLTASGFTYEYGPEGNRKTKTQEWNKPIQIYNNIYVMTPQIADFDSKMEFVVEWNGVMPTVYEILPTVSVYNIGKTTNIGIDISTENPTRGETILDKMVEVFVSMNLEDQNKMAQDKIYFIEERMGKVSGELSEVEKNLAAYQGSNLMIEGGGGGVTGEPVGQATANIAEMNTQSRVLNMVRNQLANPDTEDRILPSTLGFSDPVLSALITKYNEMLLIRQRETPLVAGNSMVLKDINNQISSVKANILDNINSIQKALNLQISHHQQQSNRFRSTAAALPQKERVLGAINRDKSIKENLYLYLLQKREETAISKTASSPYEQIDAAAAWGPVSPVRRTVYTYAIALGLLVPLGFAFLRETLSGKIRSRDEIQKVTDLPVVGEISYIKKKKERLFPALEGGIVAEQFRIMRANFRLHQHAHETKTLLVTSSTSGEGKSFISQNLAAAWARSGKRVALMEFDLRKPAENPMVTFHKRGLSEYITGNAEIHDIVHPFPNLENLHVYPAGPVIESAGDMLEQERVRELFNTIKGAYDVIVVNAPPVGLVSDALTLQQYCTATGYVVREGYSTKKNLKFLNSLIDTGKFGHTSIIYNGIKSGARNGYYPYSEAKNNPYFKTTKNVVPVTDASPTA